MNPAQRLANLRPSPIRVLSEGAPLDAIPLGLGEPTWDLPETARRALAELQGPANYGPNTGLPELRRAVAEWCGAEPEEVLITCGAQGALFSLFMAWLDAGDEVLVPDPGFPAYAALARMAGAEAVPYALDAANRFRLDPAAFVASLEAHPRAKLAVLNHPSNPTGGGASAEALKAVARACKARGILLLSDEVYRELHFGSRPPGLRDVGEYGLVLGSVSKGWAAPGLRVGWAVGDPRWLAPARTVHANAATAAPAPCQRAAIALLEDSEAILAQGRREIGIRWEALAAAFQAHFGYRPGMPDGTFYHWMPLPPRTVDPMDFCLRMRDEAGVVLVPGHTFGPSGSTHARLSFGARPEQIEEGVRRLAPYWRNA